MSARTRVRIVRAILDLALLAAAAKVERLEASNNGLTHQLKIARDARNTAARRALDLEDWARQQLVTIEAQAGVIAEKDRDLAARLTLIQGIQAAFLQAGTVIVESDTYLTLLNESDRAVCACGQPARDDMTHSRSVCNVIDRTPTGYSDFARRADEQREARGAHIRSLVDDLRNERGGEA